MAFQGFLLRVRRKASIVAFNAALPANFKLVHKPESTWLEREGVNLDPIDPLTLKVGVYDAEGTEITSPVLSTAVHYNLRVTDAWSGWDGIMIDPGDPDYEGDPRLNKSKVKQWFKNNGGERLDDASEHPRSGRADMRWFRWTDGTEWMDITIDEPVFRRRVWL